MDGALDKTFTHDDDGNIHTALIQKTSASPSVTADYLYTSDGLRLRKSADGTVVLYHYDLAGNLIGESGIGGENFKAYVYFAGTRVATVAADGSVCYYHNNHLETPVSMTDGSGNVVWKADYKPFGRAEVASYSTVVNDFRFPGQYYDSETGLHYNWNRYYDLSTGRYLTADPIGIIKGRNHLYAYVINNPVMYIDPNGFIVWPYTDKHRQRNRNNKCPEKMPCEKDGKYYDASGNEWTQDDPRAAEVFHGSNLGFRRSDGSGGGSQCFYNKKTQQPVMNHDPITGYPIQGTYDYTNPDIGGLWGHFWDDVFPHFIDKEYENPDQTHWY